MVARLTLALTAAAVLSAASPAAAYVCSRVLDEAQQETGPALSWDGRSVPFTLHAAGTGMVFGDQERDTLRASFAVWESARLDAQTSTDLEFVETAVSERDYVGYDFLHPEANENLLVFRDDGWLHAGQGCATIALTTTTYSAQTGRIYDADIEFNSSCPDQIQFGINGDPGKMDLMNTAVHEIGHVVGLGHPDLYTELDPTCATGATMCSTARTGETSKRDLAIDDIRGVLFKYPAGAPNGVCAQPDCAQGGVGCGACSTAECEPWAACGFCAAPEPLTAAVVVSAVATEDGQGCACGASGGAAAALVGVVLLAARARARRRPRGG